MLSHHVQGYVNGLHFDIKDNNKQQNQIYDDSIDSSFNTSSVNSTERLLVFDSPNMKPSTSSSFR
jgi:hypothetical protein